MANFKNFAEANKKLELDSTLEKEVNFQMEYHTIGGVEFKLIKSLRDLDAVPGGRGAWKEGQWMWIKEKAK